MNLIYLKYFVSVAQKGSINQSANELFISPQGLSRAIRQLEADMNAALFTRDNDGLTLTPEGEVAYEYAVKILKLQDDMAFGISEISSENNAFQSLKIAAFPIISSVFFPLVLPRFFKKRPHVSLQIHYSSDFDLLDQLDGQIADIIFFTAPLNGDTYMSEKVGSAWTYEHLCTTSIVALSSKQSIFQKEKVLTESDFHTCQKIYFGNAEDLVRNLGFQPGTPALKTSDYSLFRSALAANPKAIGFSDSVVEDVVSDTSLQTLSLPADIQMEYSCFIRTQTANTPAVKDFIKILKKNLRLHSSPLDAEG